MTHIASSFFPTSINPSFCLFGLRSWKGDDPHLPLLCSLSGSSVLRLLTRKVKRAATSGMLHLVDRPVFSLFDRSHLWHMRRLVWTARLTKVKQRPDHRNISILSLGRWLNYWRSAYFSPTALNPEADRRWCRHKWAPQDVKAQADLENVEATNQRGDLIWVILKWRHCLSWVVCFPDQQNIEDCSALRSSF